MNDGEEDDTRNRLGTFLKVEKASTGYTEWDRNGKQHRYVRLDGARDLHLEKLNVHTTFDAQSSARRISICGATRQKVRAIGVTGDYPIFFATIAAGSSPGTAIIRETYSLGGHSLRGTLLVNTTEAVVAALAEAVQQAKTTRVISMKVNEGAFWGASPDAHSDVLLLPWLEEQRKEKSSEEVTVEFQLSVADLTVEPEFGGFLWGETERAENSSTSIAGPVAIYHSTKEHPLQASLGEVRSELSSLRSTLTTLLWVIAIVLILVVVRIFK